MKYSQLRQLANLLEQRGIPATADVKVFVDAEGLPGCVSFGIRRDGNDQIVAIDAVVSAK